MVIGTNNHIQIKIYTVLRHHNPCTQINTGTFLVIYFRLKNKSWDSTRITIIKHIYSI